MEVHWDKNMVKIKICGLKRMEDIEIVNEYQPEYIGFVFAHTKRYVEKETARKLREALDPAIQAVGVFVNEDISVIEELCRENIIQLVQLHGDEDLVYIEQLRKCIKQPVIKAVRVRNCEQILEAEKLPVEYLLLDTYIKGTYGGSGRSFDKSLIPELRKPYFLAGGLDAKNVRKNIESCSPYGVDVSSAMESDGVKDRAKIKAFIEAARTVASKKETE